MNETKAAMKNRVEHNYLDWKLHQIEKEKTSFLSLRNKELNSVQDDLNSIRASTGTVRKPIVLDPKNFERLKISRRSISNFEFFSRDNSYFVNDEDENLRQTNNKSAIQVEKRLISPEWVKELKQKDPVFAKRLRQFELFKKSGRAPYFEDNEKIKQWQSQFPKSIINRQRKELVEITRSSMMLRRNTYSYMNQKTLHQQISEFVKNQSSIR